MFLPQLAHNWYPPNWRGSSLVSAKSHNGIFTSCHIQSGSITAAFCELQHIYPRQCPGLPGSQSYFLRSLEGEQRWQEQPVAASMNRQAVEWFTSLWITIYQTKLMHSFIYPTSCSKVPGLWQAWCNMPGWVQTGTCYVAQSEEVHAKSY